MDVEEGEEEQEQGEDAVEDFGVEFDDEEDEDYERTARAVGAEFILHRVLEEVNGQARWTTSLSARRDGISSQALPAVIEPLV